MPRKTNEEKLAALLEQQRQLEARISAQQKIVKEKERKQEDRRKIIAGAIILKFLREKGQGYERDTIVNVIRNGLSDQDRKLFTDDMPELDKLENNSAIYHEITDGRAI